MFTLSRSSKAVNLLETFNKTHISIHLWVTKPECSVQDLISRKCRTHFCRLKTFSAILFKVISIRDSLKFNSSWDWKQWNLANLNWMAAQNHKQRPAPMLTFIVCDYARRISTVDLQVQLAPLYSLTSQQMHIENILKKVSIFKVKKHSFIVWLNHIVWITHK